MTLQLNVRVIEGVDIPKMDTFGKADPYCIVSVSDNSSDKRKTKVCKKTYTPVWNQVFQFQISESSVNSAFLNIYLKDKDKGKKDDPISSLNLSLTELGLDRVVDSWYSCKPVKGVKKGGKVRLMTHIAPPDYTPFKEGSRPTSVTSSLANSNNRDPTSLNTAQTSASIPKYQNQPSPGQTSYQNPTSPGQTGYQNPTSPGQTGYQNQPSPSQTGYQNPTSPGQTGYQNPTSPGQTGYQNQPSPSQTGYQNPTSPGQTSYQNTGYIQNPHQNLNQPSSLQRPQSNYSIQGYHQSLPTSPVSQNNVYPPGCQMVEHPVIPGVQPPIEGPAQSMMGACPPQYPSMQQNMAQHNIQPNMYSNMQPNMYSNIRPPIQQPYTMQPQYGQQPNMFGQVGNGMMNAAMGLSSVSPQAYPGAFPSPQQQYGGYPQQQQPQQQQQFGYPR